MQKIVVLIYVPKKINREDVVSQIAVGGIAGSQIIVKQIAAR